MDIFRERVNIIFVNYQNPGRFHKLSSCTYKKKLNKFIDKILKWKPKLVYFVIMLLL